MYSAVIQGMLMINDMNVPVSRKDSAMLIARIVADRLIEMSQPEGNPLEFFPPTYLGPIYADMQDEYRGESLTDRIMLVYPSVAAQAYLDLFDQNQQKKYLNAAVRIADTYKKLQLENGSWHLLIYIETGEQVANNYLVPTGVISLMDRLEGDHGIEGYDSCRNAALSFIKTNLAADYNWEGQFEDQKPSEKYKNLSKGQACGYALYLMENESGNPEKLEEAEELIRFAEDQFVIWGNPNPINSWGIKGDSWLTPCVLEQYNFYTPVNASSGNMIEVFRKLHERTGNILFLVKAIELANNIVEVQNSETGHYPTYLVDHLLDQEGWINCMVYTAKQIRYLDEYLIKINFPRNSLVK
jgi:maltose/maltodextrin transport system substrate-binding protein